MSVGQSEKSAVQTLSVLLNDNPTIIDVGSNKGEWSDTLLQKYKEVGTFHFLEPNEIMLNFTRIKYDYNTNIVFNQLAAWSKDDETLDFFYFTNYNNGLSAVVHNPKWDYLPMQKGNAKSITLDTYCERNNISYVDFVKIDVEGVEYNVLQGMKKMLESNKVRFIQIECSEHYHLIGKTFNDVIKYVGGFGYGVYGYGDNGFYKVDAETFVHDDSLQNFIITTEYIANQQSWNEPFVRNTADLPKFDFVLEIGAFEGLTSRYICQNLIKEGGRMIAVDPLDEQYLVENVNEYAQQLNNELPYFRNQYQRFLMNTNGYPIELVRKTFSQSLNYLNDFRFDFIYIDGDHRADFVFFDAINSFRLLKGGGYMLFDDFEWGNGETKRGIMKFIEENRNAVDIIKQNEQMLIRKK